MDTNRHFTSINAHEAPAMTCTSPNTYNVTLKTHNVLSLLSATKQLIYNTTKQMYTGNKLCKISTPTYII